MTLVAQEIPKIGLVMEEVKLVRWLKNVGDSVLAGEPLLEVETEKSVVEIEAAATGRLAEILIQIDGHATVGDQVAWIESPETQGAVARERILSSPVARKLAAEHSIELEALTGTGPGGRIQLDDVRRAIDKPRATDRPRATDKPRAIDKPGPVDAPRTADAAPPAAAAAPALTPMRRALARAMSLSNATIPQFTVSRSVEWTVLQALRREFSAKLALASPRLSVTDFLLQAVARALIEHPGLNATFSGDPESADARIICASGAHIGLVVAVDNGLLVPVIHDVERLGLVALARRREDCVERSVKGRLKREEADGATFSISNLGADGPDRFTAIINPPQSAILAVGRRRDCVVPGEGAIVVRPLSDLTLTVDHRVADGRLASQFLARVVEILEGRDWRVE